MIVFRKLEEIPQDFGATVLSIGNFDGVHRGHTSVLAEVVRRAGELKAKSMAVTFDPHPTRILRPEIAPKLITPLPEKIKLMERSGLDALLVLPFSRDLSLTAPRDFAQQVIAGRLKAKEIHEGENFHFGHRAEGNVAKLGEFGQEFGFEVKIYPVLTSHGEAVSSSNIRRLITEGAVNRARQLLGRVFSILSKPGRGRGYGHKYTVPTINLARYDELVPANGVYITCIRVGEERFQSVSNVGVRPTFGQDSFAIETHLLNFHEIELTADTPVELSFLKRLRPEIKFPDVQALRDQIARDVHRSRRFFAAAKLE